MKSLNDVIWDDGTDLKEGKDVIELGMKDICLADSCGGGNLDPICIIIYSYAPSYACKK